MRFETDAELAKRRDGKNLRKRTPQEELVVFKRRFRHTIKRRNRQIHDLRLQIGQVKMTSLRLRRENKKLRRKFADKSAINGRLKYYGYLGSIEVNLQKGCLKGQVLDVDDDLRYQGATLKELRQNFESQVDKIRDDGKDDDKA